MRQLIQWQCLVASLLVFGLWGLPLPALGDDESANEAASGAIDSSREVTSLFVELSRTAREAVVTVTHLGRDQKQLGLGTGFIIDKRGLVATNRHVLGDARPIEVQFLDGTTVSVTQVLAHDRVNDLAILQIDPEAIESRELTVLGLASDEELEQGTVVAAIGHPAGLKNTLVSGIVSGYEQINERSLIQVAMPIDHGNSGGPLLNEAGDVVGVITYKSAKTDNVGFAMPVGPLRELLNDPNPITMSRWVTIGSLNPTQWTQLFGANWRQRAGRISVSGTGQGFGGRSLCLAKTRPADADAFVVSVTVKLDDEAGAAGLVFQADGEDRHYGFYPSGGQLRLSRFDGADVFRWNVLAETASASYRQGDWNRLQVDVSGPRLRCYCNGELVFDVTDATYESGLVGLAKFRDTEATFRKFSVSQSLDSETLAPELVEKLNELMRETETAELLGRSMVDELSQFPESSEEFLAQQVRELRERTQLLEALMKKAHAARLQKQISDELNTEKPDLGLLALSLARFDNPEVDVAGYQTVLATMVGEVREMIGEAEMTAVQRREVLDRYLFLESGFHGSRTNYYNRSNSYLSEVLDDREGLPISLSVLYMVLGERLDLDIRGIGLPGHFVVCQYIDGEPGDYIDVFEEGEVISPLALQLRLRTVDERQAEMFLKPQSAGQIMARMVRNLKNVAEGEEDFDAVLRYLNLLAEIDTGNEVEHRYLRVLLWIRNKQADSVWSELDWLAANGGDQLGIERIEELRQFARRWIGER